MKKQVRAEDFLPQHHRKSIRLQEYDYSKKGLYFITICIQDRKCLFGKIENSKMILNNAGKIAYECWLEIPAHFPNTILHEHVIMPNHIHGIVELTQNIVDAAIVGAENFLPLWQRNYYEHIIRDEQSYQRISSYIINNPKNWKDDKLCNE